jgi:hypothetical protein
VADPALWTAAGKAMQAHAERTTGGWLLGTMKALFSKVGLIDALVVVDRLGRSVRTIAGLRQLFGVSGRDDIGEFTDLSARDPSGKAAGLDFAGLFHATGMSLYPAVDRDKAREFLPLFTTADGRVCVGLGVDGIPVALGLRTLVPTDRDTMAQVQPITRGKDGRTVLGVDLLRGRIRMADVDVDWFASDRDHDREQLAIVKARDGRILIGVRSDGIDIDFSPSALARLGAALGAGYISPTTFEGDHPVFNVRTGVGFRYATAQERDDYTHDIAQRTDIPSSTALSVATRTMYGIVVTGQSNAGAGSGPTATAPILGKLAPRQCMRGNSRFDAYGTQFSATAASDLQPVLEPVATNYGQNPASMTGSAVIALARQRSRMTVDLPVPSVVISSSWEGGQSLDKFFPATSGHFNHENTLGQVTDMGAMAEVYDKDLTLSVVLIQGEGGPPGTTTYRDMLYDWIDDVLPLYGAAAGVAGSPHLLLAQTNIGTGLGVEFGSGLGQLAAARNRLGAGVTLAGPMYQFPLHDVIHTDNLGRMMLGELVALAHEAAVVDGTDWHPLWPVAGGVTRVGAVITIPFELPPGVSGPLVFDTDWVEAITNHGFVYTDSGTPPAISSVVISGTSVVITLASSPSGSGKTIRYALDAPSSVSGWSDGRGTLYVDSGRASPYAADGFDIPTTIRHYCVRFTESLS